MTCDQESVTIDEERVLKVIEQIMQIGKLIDVLK